jgi:hypothetical protein
MKPESLTFEEAVAQLQYWRELLVVATSAGNRDQMFEAAGRVGELGVLVRDMRAERGQLVWQGSERREIGAMAVDRRSAARSTGEDRRG